jgi:hypothetical protein
MPKSSGRRSQRIFSATTQNAQLQQPARPEKLAESAPSLFTARLSKSVRVAVSFAMLKSSGRSEMASRRQFTIHNSIHNTVEIVRPF